MNRSSLLATIVLSASLATSAHAAVTASNLLAYYDFDGQSNNQFGPAPNASLGGPAALTTGNQGFSGSAGDESLNLNTLGDGSFASVPAGSHFDSLAANNAFSVSFWQFNTGFGNSSAFWLHAPAADGGMRGAQAHTPWSNGTIFFDQSGCCDGPERLTTTGAIINQWQHFVFQRDALGNREIWIDGVLAVAAGGADPVDPFDGQITIGAEAVTLANSFGGRIDEFAVWNTTLSATEVGALAGGAITTSLIPEPSGTLLGLLGLLAFASRRRRS